jgi:hypothetical protein
MHIQQRIFDFKAKISKFLLKVATTIMNGHQRFYGNDFPSIILLIWIYVCGLEQNNMFIYRKA